MMKLKHTAFSFSVLLWGVHAIRSCPYVPKNLGRHVAVQFNFNNNDSLEGQYCPKIDKEYSNNNVISWV